MGGIGAIVWRMCGTGVRAPLSREALTPPAHRYVRRHALGARERPEGSRATRVQSGHRRTRQEVLQRGDLSGRDDPGYDEVRESLLPSPGSTETIWPQLPDPILDGWYPTDRGKNPIPHQDHHQTQNMFQDQH